MVLDGSKTQTRRLAKPNERLVSDRHTATEVVEKIGGHLYERRKWAVGETYAVQPGRGKKSLGRIRVTGIRRERLQQIRVDGVIAEGFGVWRGEQQTADVVAFALLWDSIHTKPGTRWKDNPDVLVLEFRLEERYR